MDFIGYSFHFKSAGDCKKAKAAVALIEGCSHYNDPSKVRGGIDIATLTHFDDGFYLRWQKPVRCISAQTWIRRLLPTMRSNATALSICSHTSDPTPSADFSLMYRLKKEMTASKSPFHGLPALAISGSLPQAAAACFPTKPERSAHLPMARAATETDREIIKSPSSCWTLGLLERSQSLKDRAKFYQMGAYISEGTYGVVSHAMFVGQPALQVCVKQIKNDTDDLKASRIEVYALERCSVIPGGVVRLHDVFLLGSPAQAHLVLELWPYNLETYFAARLASPLEIRSAMRGPLAGLSFLHAELQLVHADVKTENILAKLNSSSSLPDIVCVLGDLGSVLQVTALTF